MPSSIPTYLGLDVGGANLKIASRQGWAREEAFPFWQRRNDFPLALAGLRSACEAQVAGPFRLGVTMTAELADCFATKEEGVREIVTAIEAELGPWHPRYYGVHGNLVTAEQGLQNWRPLAASNWHATARYLFGRNSMPESGFLIDIGSTTTDVIPVENQWPVASRLESLPPNSHASDLSRLAQGQLVYLGAGRTPVSTLLQQAHLGGQSIRLARETFATMQDVLLWRGELAEDPALQDTADGRPLTRQRTGERLARMVCADYRDIPAEWIDALVEQVWQQAVAEITTALAQVRAAHPDLPLNFVLAGSGLPLARAAIAAAAPGARTFAAATPIDRLQLQALPAQAVADFRFQLDATEAEAVA